MDFAALIEMLRSGEFPDDSYTPATIYDNVLEQYNSSVSNYESAVAAHDEKVNRIKELEAEIAALKSKNYDLMVAAPAPIGSHENESDEVDESETITIDDLFEDDEEDDK